MSQVPIIPRSCSHVQYRQTNHNQNTKLHPDGWLPWDKDFGLKTLYYAEFNNKGPGASVAARVKWPGLKVINKDEATQYTVGPFIQGDSWVNAAGVPVHFGLF